jgi:endonuclease YncB( thermonuclease family)
MLLAAIALAAAPSPAWFDCASPIHHDGDAIRCAGQRRSMRLNGIDAPEMPGACRQARRCTPGDPFAARDHLRSLTAGRAVRCRRLAVDSYGRAIVACRAAGADLSCAMVAAGHAVRRYGRLRCPRGLAERR